MQDNSPSSLSDNEDIAPTTQQLGQNTPSTPTYPLRESVAAELSPPNSQNVAHQSDVPPVVAFGSTSTSPIPKVAGQDALNANGKREHRNKAFGGYTWEKDEDAPGYSWMNKKAQDDMARAISQIVDYDQQIKARYGDILETPADVRSK